jgi:hypothetical protein
MLLFNSPLSYSDFYIFDLMSHKHFRNVSSNIGQFDHDIVAIWDQIKDSYIALHVDHTTYELQILEGSTI